MYIYENYHFNNNAYIEIDANDIVIIRVFPKNSPVKNCNFLIFIVIVLHGSEVVC